MSLSGINTISGINGVRVGTLVPFFDNVPQITTVDNIWKMAMIADTQKLPNQNPTAHTSLLTYITNQNYTMIMHCGDIHDSQLSRVWPTVDAAYDLFDTNQRYLIGIGNHDYEGGGQGSDLNRTATNFNNIFPVSRYSQHNWFYGNWPTGETTNTAAGLVIDETKYLFLNIEVHPRQGALTWAQEVIDETAPDRIIISTHHFLETGGERHNYDSDASPEEYGYCDFLTTTDCNHAVQMWDEFISLNDNIILIFGGHVGNFVGTPRAEKTITAVNGKNINQHLFNAQNNSGSNYQDAAYYRTYTFNESTNSCDVVTYNPVLDTNLTDAKNQFSFTFT